MRHLTQRIAAAGLALCLTLTLAPAALAAERGVLTYTEIAAPRYEDYRPFSEGLAAVKENGKWGYVDTDGSTVIPFQYDMAWPFSEGLAIVATLAQTEYEGQALDVYRLGFVDRAGNYTPFLQHGENGSAVPLEVSPYDLSPYDIYQFHNGYVLLKFTSFLYGTDGLPLAGTLTPLESPGDGLILGMLPDGSGIGYMDTQGMPVKVWDEESYEYYGSWVTDDEGNRTQSFHYIYDAGSFNQGLALVYQATVYAGMDSTMRRVNPANHNLGWLFGPEFSGAWRLSQSDQQPSGETNVTNAIISFSARIGLMDQDFNWVVEPGDIDDFYPVDRATWQIFGEAGLAMVKRDGYWGAIDKTGATVIPFRYGGLRPLHEGLAAFEQNGLWGFLDAGGGVAIPARYLLVTDFQNGIALAFDDTGLWFIDQTGTPVQWAGPDNLSDLYVFTTADEENQILQVTLRQMDEYLFVQKDGKYGFGRMEYQPARPAGEEMSAWAYEEVTAAIEAGLVPDYLQDLYLNNITRAEFCDLTIQAVEEITGRDIGDVVQEQTGKSLYDWMDEYPFNDTSDSNAIAAYALGIVTGRGNGVFDPYASITRQEAAAFLMRSAKVLGMDTGNVAVAGFTDSGDVGVWFTDAVNFVYQINVMSGTGNNTFSPLGSYTREQSYVTIYRLFQAVMEQL